MEKSLKPTLSTERLGYRWHYNIYQLPNIGGKRKMLRCKYFCDTFWPLGLFERQLARLPSQPITRIQVCRQTILGKQQEV